MDKGGTGNVECFRESLRAGNPSGNASENASGIAVIIY